MSVHGETLLTAGLLDRLASLPVATKVERARSPAQMDPPGDGDAEDRGRSRSRERKPPKEAADSSNPALPSGDAPAPEPKRARGSKTLHDPDAAVLDGWTIAFRGLATAFSDAWPIVKRSEVSPRSCSTTLRPRPKAHGLEPKPSCMLKRM